jgi:hypothetical protein
MPKLVTNLRRAFSALQRAGHAVQHGWLAALAAFAAVPHHRRGRAFAASAGFRRSLATPVRPAAAAVRGSGDGWRFASFTGFARADFGVFDVENGVAGYGADERERADECGLSHIR